MESMRQAETRRAQEDGLSRDEPRRAQEDKPSRAEPIREDEPRLEDEPIREDEPRQKAEPRRDEPRQKAEPRRDEPRRAQEDEARIKKTRKQVKRSVECGTEPLHNTLPREATDWFDMGLTMLARDTSYFCLVLFVTLMIRAAYMVSSE